MQILQEQKSAAARMSHIPVLTQSNFRKTKKRGRLAPFFVLLS